MTPATIAVLIAFVVVMVAMAGAFMVGQIDKGERRIVNHDRGPR